MGQLTFTAPDVSLYSQYYVNANHEVTTHANIVTEDIHFTVAGIPADARVFRSVLYVTMDGYGAGGSNLKICRIDETDVRCDIDGSGPVPQENIVRMSVRSNREVVAVATYQTNEIVFTEGWHGFSAHFKNLRLVIDYQEDSAILPPTEDDYRIMVPVTQVVRFDKSETNFDTGGVVLHPTVCTVSEEANGAYELQMEHPFDPENRWQMLTEECIIKAPIPPTVIPAVTMPAAAVWRVKSSVTQTPLYSKLPSWTSAKLPYADVLSHPGDYAWNSSTTYSAGAYVTYSGSVWQAVASGRGMTPSAQNYRYWAWVCDLSQSTGIYDPGTIAAQLAGGTLITFVADYNGTWMRVRSPLGVVGYVRRSDCEETADTEIITTEARYLYTQLFRVYEVECDEAAGTVNVSARHISYDLQRNMLFDCQLTEATPPTAIALIQGAMMNDDTVDGKARMIACDIEDVQITGDWSFQNPVQALLDPDEGVAAQAEAKVLRDNRDFFLLQNVYARGGPRLAYGVNLKGVTWTRNSDEVITRIIPRAKTDKDYLYLDELYIDSEHISDFAVIRTEVLDSEYSVGQKITKADGSEITLSKAAVIERMRQEAENRYYVDGCDAPVVTLDVDFLLLGDTEQYKQYRHLQRLNLFDRVQIDTGSTTVSAQVTAYEWDCLAGRYNGITVGKVYSQQRAKIPGYRVATGAITYSKLAPGLIAKIRGDA